VTYYTAEPGIVVRLFGTAILHEWLRWMRPEWYANDQSRSVREELHGDLRVDPRSNRLSQTATIPGVSSCIYANIRLRGFLPSW
jgi:hypothetical protein